MTEPSFRFNESIQASAGTGSGVDGTFSRLKQLDAYDACSMDRPLLMKNGNSEHCLDHDTIPCSLQTIAHCSLVRSQYFHAEADNEAPHSLATASMTDSDGVVRAKCALTITVGISSSAAKSSASRSLVFALSFHPSISAGPQIEPPSSCLGKT